MKEFNLPEFFFSPTTLKNRDDWLANLLILVMKRTKLTTPNWETTIWDPESSITKNPEQGISDIGRNFIAQKKNCTIRIRQPRKNNVISAFNFHEDKFGNPQHDLFRCSITLNIPPEIHLPLFFAIFEFFTPKTLRYSPTFRRLPEVETDLALNMALERSPGYLDRFRPDWQWAKKHGHLFPKMDFEGANPFFGRHPTWPARIGWVNCWHPEICEELGFPDPQKDARILPLCRQLPTGHWCVRLTEDPLDLDRPDHVKAIAWAYARFEKIGIRIKPAKPKKKKTTANATPATAPGSLTTFSIFEHDEKGDWWETLFDPIQATDSEQALRIFFSQQAKGRLPKPRETLSKLRQAYDEIAAEVELTMSDAFEARPVENDT